MTVTKIHSISLFSTLLLFSFVTKAQENSRYSIGINAGTLIYNGELSPWRTGALKTPAFVLGFTGHSNISSKFAARLELNFGKLRGDESQYGKPEYHQYRALAFVTRVTEIFAAAEWSPIGRERKLTPYIFAGIGYAGLKVQRDYSRFTYEYFTNEPSVIEGLRQDTLESLPGGTAIFPVGFGLKFNLSNKISLVGEAAHRFTTNDYIDGFSKVGNPKVNDSYTKYSIGIRFAIGAKDQYDCPAVGN
jgi:hypothetical protein